MVDQRPVLDLDDILRTAAQQPHVTPARRDQQPAVDDAVAVPGLHHLQVVLAVEPRRQRGGELLGHVLDHDDAGRGGAAQAAQHHLDRLHAAGGQADRHHPVGGAAHRLLHRRWADHRRAAGGRTLAAQAGRGGDIGARGRLDRRDQAVAVIGQELAQPLLGLGDEADRAGVECRHRRLAALLGQRRAHHHRRGALVHQLAQEGDAVHARHLDVQHDDVRPVGRHLRHREQRVASGADDLDATGGQLLGHEAAHHRRVVDQEGAHRARTGHRGAAGLRHGCRPPGPGW